MDDEIDRRIDDTVIIFLLVKIENKHMTEPRLDKTLMDSAYRSA